MELLSIVRGALTLTIDLQPLQSNKAPPIPRGQPVKRTSHEHRGVHTDGRHDES